MKKTLIAMVVAGVVAAPAQAEIYGSVKEVVKIINVSNAGTKDKVTGAAAKDVNGDPRGSKYVLGVKGSKDLGDGWSVGYKFAVENTNEGRSGAAKDHPVSDHNSTAKHDGSVMQISTSSLSLKDETGTTFYGNTAAATKIAAHFLNDSTSSWNKTVKSIESAGQDGIRYQSPNFSGLVFDWVMGSGTNKKALELTGFALAYSNSGVKFTYGSQAQDANSNAKSAPATAATFVASPFSLTAPISAVNEAKTDNRTAMTLGWSGMGIGATYSTATQTKKMADGSKQAKVASGITLSYKMGANKFLLGSHSVATADSKDTSKKPAASFVSLKYVRTLAKGTIGFGEYTTGSGHATDTEKKNASSTLFMTGIKHSF